MNAKMYLAGIVGGTLCSLALWFPLAEYLPSTLLNDWTPAASAGLAWGLMLLSALIVLACGASAARLSGTKSRAGASVSGAVAGWIAAMMSYILVGGAAAGVWGARPILEFGLKPAANDPQFIQLLVDSITGIHWWTALALWGTMLLGFGLGALGGALAGPAGEPDPDMTLVYQITAVSGMLTSGLMLVVETPALTTMNQATAESAAKLGLVPAYSTSAILVFPVAATFLMMLGSLLLWFYFYRRGEAVGQVMDMQVRLSAALSLGIPILLFPIVALLVYPQPMLYTLYLPFFVVIILTGGWIMRHVWMNSISAWDNTITARIGISSLIPSFLVIAAGAYLTSLPAALGDVLLVIPSIVALMPDDSGTLPPTNMIELVREHYAIYRGVGLASMLVIALISLVIGALVLMLLRFFARRSLRVSS